MFNGRQHQLRRERERGDHRPRRQRAIVGSVRNAARDIVVEFPRDAFDLAPGRARDHRSP